jgi:hypothetical protein
MLIFYFCDLAAEHVTSKDHREMQQPYRIAQVSEVVTDVTYSISIIN